MIVCRAKIEELFALLVRFPKRDIENPMSDEKPGERSRAVVSIHLRDSFSSRLSACTVIGKFSEEREKIMNFEGSVENP